MGQWESKGTIITGGGDGVLRMLDWDGKVHWQNKLQCGPILSLQLHPQINDGQEVVVVGGMDGSIQLVDAANGSILQKEKPHEKWVVRVIFLNGIRSESNGGSGDGYFVTASRHNQGGQISLSRVVSSSESGPPSFKVLQSLPFSQTVQDIALLKKSGEILVAIRDSNYLMRFQLEDSNLKEIQKVNMNSFQDDHVSFYAMTLNPSPCGRFLLVSTNLARIIIYRIETWKQMRNMYGLHVEQYFQPATTWHPDSQYIYAAAAGGPIYVFHVGTAKQVGILRGHEKNVRDMFYDDKEKCLVTASYDKTIRKFVKN
eukprot:TRINITY_DN8958_c1_g1_i1.p1 TRINITY_DN8958_c1_g1~~TRINITY_DN8958_c1_g1_i1.p1  ORF type:complete len:342 (+),score=33.93 TRINITY_DN8958_c1_g1_i1:85-1026(+)